MSESSTVYCTLTPEEQRMRRSHVRATITHQVVAVTSIVDGLHIQFKSSEELRDLVNEFIELERDCCEFLTFDLSQHKENLSLHIQGPPNAAHIIEMFRRSLQREDQ